MKAFLFATLGLMAAPLPAAAQSTYLETTCSASGLVAGGATCDRGVLYDLVSDGSSTIYSLRLTAPATHCSPVQYVVAWPPPPPPPEGTLYAVPATPLQPFAGGTNYLGETGVLGPGQSGTVDLGRGYPRGPNQLMIMVIGPVQDCNVGAIHSWGVQVQPVIVPE
jgi:hypothetical protein